MNWYLKVLRQYGDFKGRARRKEYWMYTLFTIIFAILAMILDSILGTSFNIGGINLHYGYIYLFYNLALLIPGFAVTVRRLHDIGKSGWFFLICLIPIIGCIWILIVLLKDSEPGDNEYGPNPKAVIV
jgi:uncharacterized membrane protein YhaH (DUF805 family)